jgi:hypothetical protein
VPDDGAVFEAKFMLPWNFAEDVAADKHMAQLQHNMLVTGSRRAYLSILTGGAKWVYMEVGSDPVYQTVLLQVERIFWRCVQTGDPPKVFGVDPPKAKVAAVKVVDMTASNSWAEYHAAPRRPLCRLPDTAHHRRLRFRSPPSPVTPYFVFREVATIRTLRWPDSGCPSREDVQDEAAARERAT